MKTVSFDDEAYRIVRAARHNPRESFSDVVKRTFGAKRSIEDSAGGWPHVPPERMQRIRAERRTTFGATRGP